MKRFCTVPAGLLAGFLMLSAVPAFAEGESNPVQAEPVYAEYAPAGTDYMKLFLHDIAAGRVQVVQDSEERSGLVLYDQTFSEPNPDGWRYALEPGDYILRVSVPVTADAPVSRTCELTFTVDNADFSQEPEQFIRTGLTVNCELKTAGEQQAADPEAILGSPELRAKETGNVKLVRAKMKFYMYDGVFGDHDADGSVDLEDAISVLRVYGGSLSGSADAVTARQKAVCDADGDGEIMISDARAVLQYYALGLIGEEQVWL